MTKLSPILIVAMVTQLYAFVKTGHYTLKSVSSTVCKLYLNSPPKKDMLTRSIMQSQTHTHAHRPPLISAALGDSPRGLASGPVTVQAGMKRSQLILPLPRPLA